MNELTIARAVLARQGIDASKIKFLEVGFPEMTAAPKSGRVDAISAVEPVFRQPGEGGTGARLVFSPVRGPASRKLTVATLLHEVRLPTRREPGPSSSGFATAMNKYVSPYAQEPTRNEVRSVRPQLHEDPAGGGQEHEAAVQEPRSQPARRSSRWRARARSSASRSAAPEPG
jgi:hypothetical protein